MAQDMVLPETPRRSAAMELMDTEVFENPSAKGEQSEVLVPRELFETNAKVGDEVLVRATVTSIGSKIGITPFEVAGQEAGREPSPEGNTRQVASPLY